MLTPQPEPAPGDTSQLPVTSYIQQFLWAERQGGGAVSVLARALRLHGPVDNERLAAAITEVTTSVEILRACSAVYRTGVDGGPAERDRRCMEILRADRDRLPNTASDPLARFHIIGCTREETVLGLVADPLVLDLRSVYLVLGAVMQAYLGRYRPAQYPPYSAVAGLRPVSRPGQGESRLGWWSRRFAAWQQPVVLASGPGPEGGGSHRPAASSQPPGRDSTQTMELSLPDDRWSRLTHAAGTAGNAGSLALIALLTQQFATGAPGHRPRFFTSTLDLRDYSDLGPVIGPLTDRIIFGVDLDGYADLTFKDLVRRAHAGLLDAVVHYMPYQEILALPSGPGASPDVTVHYCRSPPASAYTRAEESLARRGLSIELFRESELAACGPAAPGRPGHGSAMEVHVAESGPDMALVINFDAHRVSVDEVSWLLGGLDRLVTAVTANPEIMLSSM